MKIDFQEIVTKKLEEMAADRVIEKQIEESIAKVITDAVKSACESYSFKKDIEKKIESEVSAVVNEIGFTGYNQFIADTFMELAGTALKEDVKQKIKAVFEDIFIKKLETVKFSEIIKKYRDELLDMDDDKKYDYDNHFKVHFKKGSEDDWFKHMTIRLGLDEIDSDYKLVLSLMSYKDEGYTLTSVSFEGHDLSKLNELRYISEFESFIASLYFNKTKIELDIDEDDIDTSLGLDY